jgi:hypothetical protein
VEPGSQLTVIAEWNKTDENQVLMVTQGLTNGNVAVKGRLLLEYFNLATSGLGTKAADEFLIQERIKQFRRLQDPRNPYNSAFNDGTVASSNG